ncbi:MAG: aminotransferase class I/II-fold pyridoxal phosphate-dependent enzyme [Microscillaceae bacterium]|nr:aminotransferase class I/II-fold pyridoxal phosphate-dependent enzyme [Microscillaceae bacterium]
MDIAYIINSLGEERENYLDSVAPPIFQTVIFSSKNVAEMRRLLKEEAERPFYTRGNNPTTDILRKKIAALEQAEDALIFASGSAAIASAVMLQVQAGDHIVCVKKPYSWTNKLMTVFLPRFGIHATMVDGTDPQNFEAAIQPNTKLIYLESPNSWTFEMQDMEAVVAIAKKHHLVTIMDNSYATPLYQNPIAMGVDMTVHSATKYIAGHSDAVAGVVCGSKEMIRKLFASEYMTLGGISSPFNSWLLLRGLRTLPIRMERVSQTTAKVVEFLENHPKIEQVYYPHSPSHPQYDLALKQMKKGSGMFSIQVKADTIEQVEAFCNHLKRFLLAVSWGSYESLIFPACTLYASEIYKSPDLPWNMIRVSIGQEDAAVLIEDLEAALRVLEG